MRALTLMTLAIVAGCSNPFVAPLACTDQLNSTIALRILHATTGERIGAGSTVIVRREGVYDSVTVGVPPFPNVDYLAWENEVGAGVYSVTVRKPGFATQAFNATVTGDRCHAGPGPQIDVRLVPAP